MSIKPLDCTCTDPALIFMEEGEVVRTPNKRLFKYSGSTFKRIWITDIIERWRYRNTKIRDVKPLDVILVITNTSYHKYVFKNGDFIKKEDRW